MKAIVFTAISIIALFTVFSPPGLLGQETSPDPTDPRSLFDTTFPEVSQKLWTDFLAALEKEEIFTLGQSMRADLVRKELDEFERKTAMKGEIREVSFLHLCENARIFSGGRTLRMSSRSHQPVDGVQVRFYCLESWGKAGEDNGHYRVPDRLVEPLRFQVAADVSFTHPLLHTRIESFEAENENLATIIHRVFTAANFPWKQDPAFALAMSGAAQSERVTVSAQGLSAFEILEMATAASAWTITVNGKAAAGALRLMPRISITGFLRSREAMSYEDLAASCPGAGEAADQAAGNPYADMLRDSLAKAAKEMEAMKYRIVVGPAAK